jgi:hypothetical protein
MRACKPVQIHCSNTNRVLDLMPNEKPHILGAEAVVEMLGNWPSPPKR